MRCRLGVIKMVVCAGVVGALGLAPGSAHALVIPAVVGADSVDASPLNGVCEAPCTLRRAIQTANGSAGEDTITWAPAPTSWGSPAGTRTPPLPATST